MKDRDSIIVGLDLRSDERSFRAFHCVKCGKCIGRIIQDVISLTPGSPEAADLHQLGNRFELYCRGTRTGEDGIRHACDAKYIF